MKKVHAIYLLVLLLLCCSCGTAFWGFGSADLMKVQRGLSKNEVKKILGEPTYVRFDRAVDEWEYRQKLAEGGWTVAIVTFEDGRVVSMDTFREPNDTFVLPPQPY